jgi:mono/diheme cytochrome c family protein
MTSIQCTSTPPTRRTHRRRSQAVLGAALSMSSVGAGCYPKVGVAPPALSPTAVEYALVRWPEVTPGELAKGRESFLSHCSACHGYPDLAAIPDANWRPILVRMAAKAHLDEKEMTNVLHFVLAARTGAGA